jgi:hypothetical protein
VQVLLGFRVGCSGMAPHPKVVKAFMAMKSLGISANKVKPFLKRLLKLYDRNWELIEEIIIEFLWMQFLKKRMILRCLSPVTFPKFRLFFSVFF